MYKPVHLEERHLVTVIGLFLCTSFFADFRKMSLDTVEIDGLTVRNSILLDGIFLPMFGINRYSRPALGT